MIYYDSSGNSFATLLRYSGSVAPKAFAFACPCGLIAALLCAYRTDSPEYQHAVPEESVRVGSFIAFNSILGFLIVFRTQNAYSRYWDGLSLMHRVRGGLLNATSHVFAFLSDDEQLALETAHVRHLMTKLVSMMFCTALQCVAVSSKTDFEIIHAEGLSPASMSYLANTHDPPVVIMHWLQRVVVQSLRQQILDIPAPVLTRVFHELSNAVVALHDATKISDTPFPFAFAQMIAWMLATQFVITPLICSSMTDSPFLAGGASFIGVFLTYSMNLIASEIECPFGDDPNDLPLEEMQQTMNVSLLTLMNSHTLKTPKVMTTMSGRLHLKLAMWNDCVDAASQACAASAEDEVGASRPMKVDVERTSMSSRSLQKVRHERGMWRRMPSRCRSRSDSSHAMSVSSSKKSTPSSKYAHQKAKLMVRQGKIDHPILLVRTTYVAGSKESKRERSEADPIHNSSYDTLTPLVEAKSSTEAARCELHDASNISEADASHLNDSPLPREDPLRVVGQHTSARVSFAPFIERVALAKDEESHDKCHRACL